MFTDPICLNDSMCYNLNRYPQISDFLKYYPDICRVYESSFQFRFTGVLIINDIPVILFPKNYDIPESAMEKFKHAGIFVKVLLRYRDEPYHAESENQLLYGCGSDNARIAVAFQILEDYLANGILEREQISLSHTKSGRTDWGATIHTTIPMVNHRQILYDDTMIRIRKKDEENLIRKIHQYVVHEVISMWGWMYDVSMPANLSDAACLPCRERDAIVALCNELKQTYIQREIRLIKNMILYLTAKSGLENRMNQEILGTQYFSFVWEAVCGYLFHNKYLMIREIIPQPEWEGIDGKISQRPDILSVEAETLYILDAKYYDYNINLPGWHDVVKQMFYRHTIVHNLNSKIGKKLLPNVCAVKNVFLFPGEESERLKYLGCVKVKEDPELGEVKAYAINQWDAMKTYAYRNNDGYRDELFEILKRTC